MKKKILAVITAAVLALGCASAAFAATGVEEFGSPNTISINKTAKKALTTGWKWDEDAQEWTPKAIWSVSDIATYGGDTDDFKIQAFKEGKHTRLACLAHLLAQYTSGNYKVVRLFNLDNDADSDDPVAVTLADLDIKASKKYALVRMDDETGEWATSFATGISSKDGLVKFNATKKGNVALLEIKGSSANTPATDAKAATGTKTAPKTGEV